MPPKFVVCEDPYLFICQFKGVCSLIHMLKVSIDVMRTKFIHLALIDDAKWF